HIMHWPSPWSEGFPGWHLECSTMGEKYLGTPFDIHGGGMDLKFPHHECEIAQSVAHNGHDSVNYWMHNNMITINGQKMGKSLGNFITLDQMFEGSHPLLSRPYSPMEIRFFILQAHYRGTLDFSDEALQGAQKALARMLEGYQRLQNLKPSETATPELLAKVNTIAEKCKEALDDDLNTPIVIANLFEACSIVNNINDGREPADEPTVTALQNLFDTYMIAILGLEPASSGAAGKDDTAPFRKAVDLLLDLRSKAKAEKDWATSDMIRDRLSAIGFDIKDTKNGYEWSLK
ncbi:MAG: cysteine--tRNA ligase, partial [Paramuribaculum sp.]|nr:cysteine--tRNA ligase [Paramuribaculum sp.]